MSKKEGRKAEEWTEIHVRKKTNQKLKKMIADIK
jgi:hypothetical protein